jgi:putative membrane protein
MKNILNIIKHDTGKLTSSVVAIITIMGLCIVPCLYAWFNIFSNWDPYESDATGRILVAVANEDDGSELLGLDINVGEKIVEALKANDSIGWRFTDDSEAAIEGVKSGEYYAALVVPEDFSMNVMSFVTGNLENPKLIYYENEKKNAIAPKITGKAKTAVQEQVNAAFIETLAEYVSDAASIMDASGYNPQKVFADLGDKMNELGDRLEDCEVMMNAAEGLANSAGSLLKVSDALLGSAQVTVQGSEDLLDTATDGVPESKEKVKDSVTTAVDKEKTTIANDLDALKDDLNKVIENKDEYNEWLEKKLAERQTLVENMRQSSEKTAKYLEDLGYTGLAEHFRQNAQDMEDLRAKMDQLETATEENWEEQKQKLEELRGDMDKAKDRVKSVDTSKIKELDTDLRNAISNARKSLKGIRGSLDGMESSLGNLGDVLSGYSTALGKLQNSLNSTEASLGYMRNGVNAMAEIFNRIGNNESLSEVGDILASDEASVAEYLASPVKMDTEVIYPIATYGSAMAPFYTVLAQWVGALLTAVLIKVRVRKRDDLQNPNLVEQFFGRYGLYLFIGLAQALIVSLGDLLYVDIQCHHPILFVLQACMNGIVFMMINYALAFALENIGLGAGVIILVLQVAGSGGTYPVEVLPKVFQVLYPVMPFKYSMNAMRECIGGMYGNTYANCMGALCLFFIGSVIFGLLLHKPAQLINKPIQESKDKSEIML